MKSFFRKGSVKGWLLEPEGNQLRFVALFYIDVILNGIPLKGGVRKAWWAHIFMTAACWFACNQKGTENVAFYS